MAIFEHKQKRHTIRNKVTFDSKENTVRFDSSQMGYPITFDLTPEFVDFMRKGLEDCDPRLMPCIEDAIASGLVED